MAEQSREEWLHELARRAKQGDKSALEQLLTTPDIKNVIYKTANEKVGPTDADDVYQLVCELIWKKLETWQEQAKITTWVKRVTYNACIDFLRKTKAHTLIFTDTLPPTSQEPEQQRTILDQEKDALIVRALHTIEDRCRQILTLFLEGRKRKAIMQAVKLKKTAFHEEFKLCCQVFEQKIRRML